MLVYKCDGCEKTLEPEGQAYEVHIYRYGHGKLGDLSKIEGGTVIHLCFHCYERWVQLLREDLGIAVGLKNWKT